MNNIICPRFKVPSWKGELKRKPCLQFLVNPSILAKIAAITGLRLLSWWSETKLFWTHSHRKGPSKWRWKCCSIHGSCAIVLGFGRGSNPSTSSRCHSCDPGGGRRPGTSADNWSWTCTGARWMSHYLKRSTIFNTIPALVLTGKVLKEYLPARWFLIWPGVGGSIQKAASIGISALALGIPGKVAPKTAGRF